MYTYHIVYMAGNMPNFQIGDLTIKLSCKIDSSSNLEKVRNALQKDKNEQNIVILNWQELTKED